MDIVWELKIDRLPDDHDEEREARVVLRRLLERAAAEITTLRKKTKWECPSKASGDEPVLLCWELEDGRRVVGEAWKQEWVNLDIEGDLTKVFGSKRFFTYWSHDHDGREWINAKILRWMPLPDPWVRDFD